MKKLIHEYILKKKIIKEGSQKKKNNEIKPDN